MGTILKGYNLGEMGVNVAKSPIHLTDGELVSAQNAEFYVEAGQGAIRKRPGLQRFNTSVLAGQINGVIGVPLPAVNERLVAMLVDTASGPQSVTFRASNDLGVTAFANITPDPQTIGGEAQLSHQDRNGNAFYRLPALSFNGVGYYAAAPITAGSYDSLIAFEPTPSSGTTPGEGRVYSLIRFASAATIEAIFRYKQYIYCAVRGAGGFGNYVYRVDPQTGVAILMGLGTTFVAGTENVFSGCGFLGEIWIGTSKATQGVIYHARVSDASWTQDDAGVANHHTITSMAVYKGNLYVATAALAGTAALIRRRTPAGVWSTSATGSHSTQANIWDALYVFNGTLFAVYHTAGATDICELWKFDNSSWANDEDLKVTHGVYFVHGIDSSPQHLWLSGDDETHAVDYLLKRDTSGTFTKFTQASGSLLLGQLLVL